MRISGRKLSILLFLLLLAALVIRVLVLCFGEDEEECFYRRAYDQWETAAVCRALPLLSFEQEKQPQNPAQLLHQVMAQAFPWYAYEQLYLQKKQDTEVPGTEKVCGEETAFPEMEQELEKVPEKASDPGAASPGTLQETADEPEGGAIILEETEMEEAEKEAADSFETRLRAALEDPWGESLAEQEAAPVFAQALIDNAWWDFHYLCQNWYTVDTSTDAAAVGLSAPEMATLPMGISRQEEGYDILLYHTHSLEQYADSAQYEAPNGVVGAGELLAALLEERYGYRVLHLTESFDAQGRDYAYGRALPVLQEVLAEHPEIQVVIDLHRDEVDSRAHLVGQVDGRSVARYMFFNGLSYTRSLGTLESFPNPYQKENLAFSYQMQLASEALFPGCARRIYLKGYRYNMHLRGRSLLIELGAQNNTEQEAWNSCVLLAKMLDTVLSYSIR